MSTNLEKSALSESSLDSWLATATSKLCAEAQERIEAEVRRHVDETVAALLTEGYSADATTDEAVSRLGRPESARRAYRRANLTRAEYGVLTRPISVTQAFSTLPQEFARILCMFADISMASTAIVFIGVYIGMGFYSRSWHVSAGGLFLVCVFVQYFSGRVADQYRVHGVWHRVPVFMFIHYFAFLTMVLTASRLWTNGFVGYVCLTTCILMFGMSIFGEFLVARLWWKMRRVAVPVGTDK